MLAFETIDFDEKEQAYLEDLAERMAKVGVNKYEGNNFTLTIKPEKK